MISRDGIKEFLNRDLYDSDYLKDLDDDQISEKLETLDPKLQFSVSPLRHQKVGVYIGIKKKKFLFFFDPGLGKTKTTLEIASHLWEAGQLKRGLIFVPSQANVESWIRENRKHTPHLRIAGSVGERQDKLEGVESDTDLFVTTYSWWQKLVCRRKQNKAGEFTGGLELDEKVALSYERRFNFVTFDESTYIQNHQSLPARLARRFIRTAEYRFALTGTPFGRDPISLWSQFYVIDEGETLGETLTLYRSVFFIEKKNWYTGFPDYKFDKTKQDDLYRALRNRSIRYRSEECLDLPEQVFQVRKVGLPLDTRAYYDKLVRDSHVDNDGTESRKNTFYSQRSITAGFLTLTDGSGEKYDVVFKDNPKLDALVELINEIPIDRKVIIFNIYHKTGEIICNRLKEEKIKHIRLYGETKGKQKATIESRFTDDEKVRVLVCSEAGAFGLNLQVANYAIFYESPTSPIRRKQMEDRIHRFGQNRKTFYWDLAVTRSVDLKVLAYLAEGKDLFDAVVDGTDRREDPE